MDAVVVATPPTEVPKAMDAGRVGHAWRAGGGAWHMRAALVARCTTGGYDAAHDIIVPCYIAIIM